MKLKKYNPAKYVGNIRRFGVSLKEKVVFPDNYSKEIQKIISGKWFKYVIFKYREPQNLLKKLNKLFKHFKISFEFDPVPKGGDSIVSLGFNGAGTLSDKYNSIFIVLNKNFFKSSSSEDNFNKMCKGFINLLNHEIIHRQQKTFVANEKLKRDIYDNSPNDSDKVYYYSKYEIMAHAYTIIQDWKLLGNMTDTDIINSLRTKRFQDISKLWDYSNAFRNYTVLFDMDSDVIKLLYKYIYMYLKED